MGVQVIGIKRIGIHRPSGSSSSSAQWWTKQLLLNYTSRSGLDLLETGSGSSLNAKIIPAVASISATNYLVKQISNFKSGDASGYVEVRIYYDGSATTLYPFSSFDNGTNASYGLQCSILSGIPRIGVSVAGGNVRYYIANAALSVGWHTVRFICNTTYSINVDGSPVAGAMYSAHANDGLWLSSIANRDNIAIGAIVASTLYNGAGTCYIDYVDYNGSCKWYLGSMGKYCYDVLGGNHMEWIGSNSYSHLIYTLSAGTYLLDTGYSIWSKAWCEDEYVPYASAGTPYDPSAFLTGYTKFADYPGSVSTYNKAPALIGFNETSSADSKLAIFDRSNATRENIMARSWSFYNATSLATKSRYHSTRLFNMNELRKIFNDGYEYSVWPVQNDAQTELLGFNTVANQSGSNITKSYTITKNTYSAKETKTTDPVWVKKGAVVEPDQVSEKLNCLEPTVIYDTNPQILTGETSVFKMWHSGGLENYGDDINIYYAESIDGISWTKYTTSFVLANHSCGYVCKISSTYYLFASLQSGANYHQQIDVYTSSNGIAWTSAKANAIPKGPAVSSDARVGNCWFAIEGGVWYMLYDGFEDPAWVMLLATSTDGLNWTKRGKVNGFVGTKGGCCFFKVGDYYYNWNHGCDTSAQLPSDLYRYRSKDFINWERDVLTNTLVRTRYDEGVNLSSGQMADPSILEHNGKVYLFYDASPNASTAFRVKLAIANMTLTQLVLTNEGEIAGGSVKPSVTTTSPTTNIAQTTATSGGNVRDTGDANVTARGVCWGTTRNPTIADFKTVDNSGLGAYGSSLTGLSVNTLYHIRAYATNANGTAYGLDVSFTTLA